MEVTQFIKSDPDEVRAMFQRFEQLPRTDGRARQDLMDQIGEELEVHAMTEEKCFYPALGRIDHPRMEHSQHEHQEIRSRVGAAQGKDPASAEFETLGAEELTRPGREFQEQKQHTTTSLLQRGVRAVRQAAQKIASSVGRERK